MIQRLGIDTRSQSSDLSVVSASATPNGEVESFNNLSGTMVGVVSEQPSTELVASAVDAQDSGITYFESI